jgi:hypothetical protein
MSAHGVWRLLTGLTSNRLDVSPPDSAAALSRGAAQIGRFGYSFSTSSYCPPRTAMSPQVIGTTRLANYVLIRERYTCLVSRYSHRNTGHSSLSRATYVKSPRRKSLRCPPNFASDNYSISAQIILNNPQYNYKLSKNMPDSRRPVSGVSPRTKRLPQ